MASLPYRSLCTFLLQKRQVLNPGHGVPNVLHILVITLLPTHPIQLLTWFNSPSLFEVAISEKGRHEHVQEQEFGICDVLEREY